MNKIKIIAISLIAIFLSSVALWAGPTQLTDSQMTEMSMDDTVVSPDQNDGTGISPNAKLDSIKKQSVIGQIKNPVDDPAVLNQAELLRLEKQAADQRVNDQIQHSMQGVYNK